MSTIIDTSLLRVDGGTQSRAALSEDIVTEYALAMSDGATFPPVVVFYDGSHYWVADGFHRVAAYVREGTKCIDCDVRQGAQRDAILFSVGANVSHGLRRTNADKRRSVETLLRDLEWVQWSDREIAKRCGVGALFVFTVRHELMPSAIPNSSSEQSKRLGGDGVWRRMPTRTQPKRRPLLSSEETLLRCVAASEGVYVLRAGNLLKVGWSRELRARVSGLVRDHGAVLVAVARGSQRDERMVHKAIHCEREIGEWFKASFAEVVAAMVKVGLDPQVVVDDGIGDPKSSQRTAASDPLPTKTASTPSTQAREVDDFDPGPEPHDDECVIADADAEPVIVRERPTVRRWGEFELASAVALNIRRVQSFRDELKSAFDAVEPAYREEFASRLEPTLLAMFVDVRERLPLTARRVEENRAQMRVIEGGK